MYTNLEEVLCNAWGIIGCAGVSPELEKLPSGEGNSKVRSILERRIGYY